MEHISLFLYKMRYLYVGLLVIAALLFLSILLSTITTDGAQIEDGNSSADSLAINSSDNPNVITVGLFTAGNKIEEAINTAGSAADSSVNSIGTGSNQIKNFTILTSKSIISEVYKVSVAVGRGISSSFSYTAHTIGGGIGSIAKPVSKGVKSVLHIPGNILGFISHSAVVNLAIRPADHQPVPIIDSHSPELHEARIAMNTTNRPPAQPESTSAWPIHGKITTKFGVSHWPYQPIHTGLDISDGQPSGVTLIKPFKPGRVIEAGKSNKGLGNHVVVDHGRGVTSVYGHLASLTVEMGQVVDMSTTLGFEGSTGVSTCTHLHFEIRVNGQAADPYQFIDGQP